MEAGGRICEEWSSLSGFYTAEEADFMTQLLSNTCAVQHELHQEIPNPSFHESTVVSFTGSNNNTSCFPSIVGNDSLSSFDSMCMGFAWGDAKFMPFSVEITDEELVKRALAVADKNLQANRECETQVSESVEKVKSSSLENSEKRSRSSLEVSKNKRNVKPKNTKPASMSNNEEDRSQRQSSSSCCSEEFDSNGGATSRLSPKDSAALNSNAKSMPHKGAASDPQSLYARRRRERINERLRILQNLVPNGTKVDISTMLEEAVQYVKFLQLQIKLLSSDDLWMYAPIAYNGLNIGLDLNFTPTKQP